MVAVLLCSSIWKRSHTVRVHTHRSQWLPYFHYERPFWPVSTKKWLSEEYFFRYGQDRQAHQKTRSGKMPQPVPLHSSFLGLRLIVGWNHLLGCACYVALLYKDSPRSFSRTRLYAVRKNPSYKNLSKSCAVISSKWRQKIEEIFYNTYQLVSQYHPGSFDEFSLHFSRLCK